MEGARGMPGRPMRRREPDTEVWFGIAAWTGRRIGREDGRFFLMHRPLPKLSFGHFVCRGLQSDVEAGTHRLQERLRESRRG
ncbi:hypothetical protein ElyMa_003478900 [Elysia marginata]|uniref:Uncharacterized protein n=1 Tax=Elysia marginata TaxID=1093978 RepID=A0AAV4EC57_9GAST|nr:hypothetical protein ElyMa_003478900 [Elysia marginata]